MFKGLRSCSSAGGLARFRWRGASFLEGGGISVWRAAPEVMSVEEVRAELSGCRGTGRADLGPVRDDRIDEMVKNYDPSRRSTVAASSTHQLLYAIGMATTISIPARGICPPMFAFDLEAYDRNHIIPILTGVSEINRANSDQRDSGNVSQVIGMPGPGRKHPFHG